jgi:hypothetical protein
VDKTSQVPVPPDPDLSLNVAEERSCCFQAIHTSMLRSCCDGTGLSRKLIRRPIVLRKKKEVVVELRRAVKFDPDAIFYHLRQMNKSP